jgi:hypothetical protein
MEDHTEPDASTRTAERAEYGSSHDAGRDPRPDEEAAADEEYAMLGRVHRAEVAEHEHEMNRIGATTRGEGAIP